MADYNMNQAVYAHESGRWKLVTSAEVNQWRDAGTFPKEVRERFHCHGCYEEFIRQHQREPERKHLPRVSHCRYQNTGSSFFRRWPQSPKNPYPQEHLSGCIHNNPERHIQELARQCNVPRKTDRSHSPLKIRILQQAERRSTSINNKSRGRNTRIGSETFRPPAYAHFFEGLYFYFLESGWEHQKIETEDGDQMYFSELVKTPDEVIMYMEKIADQEPGPIFVVRDRVKKVKHRGLYTRIFFEQGSSESPTFQLTISPDSLYRHTDFDQLEGRMIACYGRVEKKHQRRQHEKYWYEMMLYSLDAQVAFLDLGPKQKRPVIQPVLDLERIQQRAKSYLEREYGAELKSLINLQYYRNQLEQLEEHQQYLLQTGIQKYRYWEAERKRREKMYQDAKQHQDELSEKIQSLQKQREQINKGYEEIKRVLAEMESNFFTKARTWIQTEWRKWQGYLGPKVEAEAEIAKHRNELDRVEEKIQTHQQEVIQVKRRLKRLPYAMKKAERVLEKTNEEMKLVEERIRAVKWQAENETNMTESAPEGSKEVWASLPDQKLLIRIQIRPRSQNRLAFELIGQVQAFEGLKPGRLVGSPVKLCQKNDPRDLMSYAIIEPFIDELVQQKE